MPAGQFYEFFWMSDSKGLEMGGVSEIARSAQNSRLVLSIKKVRLIDFVDDDFLTSFDLTLMLRGKITTLFVTKVEWDQNDVGGN